MKKIHVEIPLDYVQGYLRYGHLESDFELTDEEFEKFQKDPLEFEDYIHDFGSVVVDDYSIDDYGDLSYSDLWCTVDGKEL